MIHYSKSYRVLFILLLCWVFSFLLVYQGYAQNTPTGDYQALLDRLKNGDVSINLTELRMLSTQLPDYNPYRTMIELKDKENQMWKAYKDGKYEEALQFGNSILEINYLRSMTHYIFSEIYGKQGNPQKQKFHVDVFFNLVDSVINSGDGKSPETAMTVIEIDEEYNVLDVLGFEKDSQTLIEKDGKRFDQISAKNPETGEVRDFYFNIDLFYDKSTEMDDEVEPVSDTTPLSEMSSPPEMSPVLEPTPGSESEAFLDRIFIATLVTGTRQEIEEFIQKRKINLKLRDKSGNTALMIAADDSKDPEVVRYLLTLGIDVNAQNKNGDTALIRAASLTSEPTIISLLLEAGANPTIKNQDGTLAYKYAQLNPALQNSEVLTRLGQLTVNAFTPTVTPHPPVPTSEAALTPTPLINLPEPSLMPIPTSTPQITPIPLSTPVAPPSPTVIPQPTMVKAPQSLIVNPPPGWIPQQPGDPTQIGYYQLANQQGVVVAEYIVILETLSSPMDLKRYLSFLQGSRLKPPNFNGYIPQQTGDTTLAGLPALRHDFLFTTNNLQLKAMAVFVILDNTAYTFLFYSTLNDFPNLEAAFNQALSTVTTQGAVGPQPTPFIPTPPVNTYTSPTPQQPSTGNWYQDPTGLFGVPLPAGSMKKPDIQNGVVFSSPNNGEIYVMNFPSETEAQNMVSSLAGGKSFRAETTLNAGNRQAQVKIYSFSQNNTNYAMLLTSYPGTSLLVIIVIPADQYNPSQAWMMSTLTGVRFK